MWFGAFPGAIGPLRGLQEPRVATREESGVLGFPSRRGLTPRGSLVGFRLWGHTELDTTEAT